MKQASSSLYFSACKIIHTKTLYDTCIQLEYLLCATLFDTNENDEKIQRHVQNPTNFENKDTGV
jgi:hypothetical protein